MMAETLFCLCYIHPHEKWLSKKCINIIFLETQLCSRTSPTSKFEIVLRGIISVLPMLAMTVENMLPSSPCVKDTHVDRKAALFMQIFLINVFQT